MSKTQSFYVILIAFLISILASNSHAQWFDDFESASIGDPLWSLGYFAEYANEATIDTVGVNGSQGFMVPAMHPWATWPGAWLYGRSTIANTGDSIEMSIDVQFQMADELVSFRPNEQVFEFQISNFATGGFFFAQIGFDAASNYQQYRLYEFDSQNENFVVSDPFPVSDLGLTGSPNEVSNFFKFHLSITKVGANRFSVEIQVRDLNGNTLSSLQVATTDLGQIFDGQPASPRFGHFMLTSPLTLDNLRYDNYSYQVTQASEVPVGPDSIVMDRGIPASFPPDFELLEYSDNQDFSISRAAADIVGATQFQARIESPVETPTSMEIHLEAAVFARSTVNQKIEIYDYVEQDWIELDERQATRFTDSSVTVTYEGDFSKVISVPDRYVTIRVTHTSVARRQRFSSNIDRLVVIFGLE